MKRKPTDIIFKVEHQFTLYLQRCNVTRESLPPDQLREMRRAFYGAAGQMFFLMTEDISSLSEREYPGVLDSILDQIQEYWNKEQEDQLNGRQEYAKQLGVKCADCGWEGAVADLIKPEKGAVEDRCKCPKCGSFEMLVPKAVAPGPKPFQPVLKDPKAFYLHEAYGITEERRLELSEKMAAIHNSMLGTITPVHYRMDQIAQISESPAEFAYCVYTDGLFLAKNGYDL